MTEQNSEAEAEMRRQMEDSPLRNFMGSSYCGTTVQLYVQYCRWRDQSPRPVNFPPATINKLRFEYVCWHQQMYKRRFWSRALLVRLLQHLVFYFYEECLIDGRIPLDDFSSETTRKPLFESISRLQTTTHFQFQLTLRPIPEATLFPKLDWLLDKLIGSVEEIRAGQSELIIERDLRSPTEFFQHWMNWVRDENNNLPTNWFSWHNDEFPEYFEWDFDDEEYERNLGTP